MKGPWTAGIILLALGIFVCQQALRLSLGRASRPEPGFVPFGLGAILILLSILYLAQILRTPSRSENLRVGPGFYRTFLGMGLLCLVSGVLNWLGYLISTFLLFMGWLILVERKKWILSLALSGLALVIVYYFNFLFSVQLPKGLMKGF